MHQISTSSLGAWQKIFLRRGVLRGNHRPAAERHGGLRRSPKRLCQKWRGTVHGGLAGSYTRIRAVACYRHPEKELFPIDCGNDLVVRVQEGARLPPKDFIGDDGVLNLIELRAVATQLEWNVVFVGVWDGSLSLGCALAVIRHQTRLAPQLTPSGPVQGEVELRTFKVYTCNYVDFKEYSRDFRVV